MEDITSTCEDVSSTLDEGIRGRCNLLHHEQSEEEATASSPSGDSRSADLSAGRSFRRTKNPYHPKRKENNASREVRGGVSEADSIRLDKISSDISSATGPEATALRCSGAGQERRRICATSGVPAVQEVPAKRPAKKAKARRKKPDDRPRRPLSAYNLFFKAERAKMIAQHSSSRDGVRVGFSEMGKMIAKKWKEIHPGELMFFKNLARKEKERHRLEMVAYSERRGKRQVPPKPPPTASTSIPVSTTAQEGFPPHLSGILSAPRQQEREPASPVTGRNVQGNPRVAALGGGGEGDLPSQLQGYDSQEVLLGHIQRLLQRQVQADSLVPTALTGAQLSPPHPSSSGGADSMANLARRLLLVQTGNTEGQGVSQSVYLPQEAAAILPSVPNDSAHQSLPLLSTAVFGGGGTDQERLHELLRLANADRRREATAAPTEEYGARRPPFQARPNWDLVASDQMIDSSTSRVLADTSSAAAMPLNPSILGLGGRGAEDRQLLLDLALSRRRDPSSEEGALAALISSLTQGAALAGESTTDRFLGARADQQRMIDPFVGPSLSQGLLGPSSSALVNAHQALEQYKRALCSARIVDTLEMLPVAFQRRASTQGGGDMETQLVRELLERLGFR